MTLEPNPIEGRAVAEKLARVLRPLSRGRFEFVRSPDMQAVPAISNAHLSSHQQESIAKAFASSGASTVYAVAMESLENIPGILRFETSTEGLKSFNRRCAHFNYALTSSSGRNSVLCTTDEYLIFLGSPAFVAACLDMSQEEGRKQFYEYARDPEWSEPLRRSLTSVDEVCMSFESLRAGQVAQVPHL